jgi:hypothetical protein
MLLFLAIGTEFTEIGADVGVVDVLIINKKCLITVLALTNDIGEIADSQNIWAVKKTFAVFQRKTFFGSYLGKNIAKTGLFNE